MTSLDNGEAEGRRDLQAVAWTYMDNCRVSSRPCKRRNTRYGYDFSSSLRKLFLQIETSSSLTSYCKVFIPLLALTYRVFSCHCSSTMNSILHILATTCLSHPGQTFSEFVLRWVSPLPSSNLIPSTFRYLDRRSQCGTCSCR